MSYTIEIRPPVAISKELQNIISTLPNKYKYPIFYPHITVLGSIDRSLADVKRATEKVAVHLQKLKLTLGQVSCSTTYFQSVFIRVDSIAPLLQLNLDLKKLLQVENEVYMPHISLLYGEHDMQTRVEIASKIKIIPRTFIVRELAIVTGDAPEEWREVVKISFGR